MVGVLEAVLVTESDKADSTFIGVLTSGQSVWLVPGWVEIHDPVGTAVRRLPLDGIADIRRGGADVMILYGYTDPINLTFRQLSAAQELERRLSAILGFTSGSSMWWQFWKRPSPVIRSQPWYSVCMVTHPGTIVRAGGANERATICSLRSTTR